MTFEQWWKEYCVKHSIVDRLRGKPRPSGRGGCQQHGVAKKVIEANE